MKKLGITSLSLALALGLSTLPVMLQAAPNASGTVATTSVAPATTAGKVAGPQVKKSRPRWLTTPPSALIRPQRKNLPGR